MTWEALTHVDRNEPCRNVSTAKPRLKHKGVSQEWREVKGGAGRKGSRLYKIQMPWEELPSGRGTGVRQTALFIGRIRGRLELQRTWATSKRDSSQRCRHRHSSFHSTSPERSHPP